MWYRPCFQVIANNGWCFASCAPNVHIRFDIPTFSLRVIALREIKAGEQLFYCYCSPNESVKKRRKQLATYGFECQCKVCTNATPESDKLREEITDRIQKIVDMKDSRDVCKSGVQSSFARSFTQVGEGYCRRRAGRRGYVCRLALYNLSSVQETWQYSKADRILHQREKTRGVILGKPKMYL